MKTKFSILLTLILFSVCFSFAEKKNKKFSIDTSSVRMYLDMATKADKGVMPTDAEWDSLFNSAAYKALLDKTSWNKKDFKNNVRDAFEIVYDPVNKQKRDSIEKVLPEMVDFDDELALFVSTALDIRKNLSKYSTLLSTADLSRLASDANTMALELIPDKGAGLEPEYTPIFLIVWDMESRSMNGGLFLDINTLLHRGQQGAKKLLAHEMHHFYLGPLFEKNYKEDMMDGAIAVLVFSMREGVADILNKKKMPLKSLYPYNNHILAKYNADYFATPELLQKLDSITCQYLDKKLPIEDYFEQAISCAPSEGHTTGSYMAFLIRDQLGMDAVVESVGDLDAFLDNYNKAAKKAGTYIFSDRFNHHIHTLSQAAKKQKP